MPSPSAAEPLTHDRAAVVAAPTAGRRAAAALGVMAASGFAGLGCQIVWTQQGALWLGHEAAAVLAVVTAFFGGLACGALALGRRIERSARPQRWYAGCEAAIAAWSALLAVAMAPASRCLLLITGSEPGAAWQAAVAFVGTFLLLLPATAAMGATLPAMERVVAGFARQRSAVAALYACNTFGAVGGVLATAFWLVPTFGLVRTLAVCAACNTLCAVVALLLLRDDRGAAATTTPLPLPVPLPLPLPLPLQRQTGPATGSPAAVRAPAPTGGGRALGLLAASGLLGIGYEVLVVRVLAQVTESTVYTFALLLAVYLIGTAWGAAAWHRRAAAAGASTGRPDDAPAGRLPSALAAACLLGGGSLWAAEHVRQFVQQALQESAGPLAASFAAEAVLAIAAFGLPTAAMGALFSQLCGQARGAGIGFARALGVNTLAAAAAPVLFGVLLLPALAAKATLLLIVAAYLALCSRHAWSTAGVRLTAGAALGLAVVAPPLVFVDVPDGGRIVSYREGTLAAVSVVEDAAGVMRLRIDNHQQEGSSDSLLADARQAWLPLLLHPAPRRALFLGLGTGVTASAAAADPTLQVDVAELLPEVIAASARFTSTVDSGDQAAAPNPRLHLFTADARRFVQSHDARYDVIVSDNFHPARSGSGALYTVEHFQAVRSRLAEGGVFCQWLPLHQLDLETLRSIVRSFNAAYPAGFALLATNSLETPVLGLLARADGGRFDRRQVRERLAGAVQPQRLASFGIADEFALLGGFVAGPGALARFASDAPLNTDDRPVVAYRAPRITYAPDSSPADRLLALLARLDLTPEELVEPTADTASSKRLAAYWAARDRFIAAGRRVRPSADVRDMLAQVREPLLAVLQASPDFRPAYDPLLRMAAVLARTDAPAARALLGELARLQPLRPEAARALAGLDGAATAGQAR